MKDFEHCGKRYERTVAQKEFLYGECLWDCEEILWNLIQFDNLIYMLDSQMLLNDKTLKHIPSDV